MMKAYGLALTLRNTLGIRTLHYQDHLAGEDRLAVLSPLGPTQLDKLRELVINCGWRLAYERDFHSAYPQLRIIPTGREEQREEASENGE